MEVAAKTKTISLATAKSKSVVFSLHVDADTMDPEVKKLLDSSRPPDAKRVVLKLLPKELRGEVIDVWQASQQPHECTMRLRIKDVW